MEKVSFKSQNDKSSIMVSSNQTPLGMITRDEVNHDASMNTLEFQEQSPMITQHDSYGLLNIK